MYKLAKLSQIALPKLKTFNSLCVAYNTNFNDPSSTNKYNNQSDKSNTNENANIISEKISPSSDQSKSDSNLLQYIIEIDIISDIKLNQIDQERFDQESQASKSVYHNQPLTENDKKLKEKKPTSGYPEDNQITVLKSGIGGAVLQQPLHNDNIMHTVDQSDNKDHETQTKTEDNEVLSKIYENLTGITPKSTEKYMDQYKAQINELFKKYKVQGTDAMVQDFINWKNNEKST